MKHFNKIKFSIHQLRQRFKNGEVTRWQKVKYLVLALFACFLTFSLVLFAWIFATLPDINDPTKVFAAQSSFILDRNGVVLYKIKGDEDREIVPFDKISKWAGLAAISIEDDQFYNHGGFDVPALLKSVCSELHVCSQARGGSTITQQYIKNAYLSSERTYTRKAKEIILAMQLEHQYTKDEILGFYLNRIPYGGSVYGVQVASLRFFGKPASELTIAESAILASLPREPSYYSPYGEHTYARIEADPQVILDKDLRTEQDLVDADPEYIAKGLLGKTYTFGEGDEKRDIYIKGRVEFVLQRMLDLGHITEEQMKQAQQEADSITFKPIENSLNKAEHFVMYVQALLEDPKRYGVEKITKGGLKITTTLDYEMQKMAEEAIDSRAETNANNYGANNASLIALDPNTGQILAMVGSRDYFNDEIDGQVNVTLAPREPGSSFKPIVYAAAFLKGFSPSTIVYDIKTTFDSYGTPYTPNNYGGKFVGPISLRNALGSSLNIPAIKAAYAANMETVVKLARDLGIVIEEKPTYGLAMAIGAGVVSPMQMASAYGAFANGGYKVEPVSILKIEDSEGNILEEYTPPKEKKRVLDPQVAFLINDVLTDKNARPAGLWRNTLTLEAQLNGAKTGTSNIEGSSHATILPRDNWTIGYVRNLVAAVWVGNTGGQALKPAADGLTTAAPIWKAFMQKAITRVEAGEYEKPEGLKWVNISKRSGNLASKNTPSGDIVKAPFASFGVPIKYDNSYQVVKIDKVSGKLATEFTPADAIEEKVFYTAHDILPLWDKDAQAWARSAGQAGGAPPTEYDDVHTAETMNVKPEISIISPSSSSLVSPPRINVIVDIKSPGGVQRVDYYLDDQLLSTVSNSPYNGSLPISADFAAGSVHSIKAVIFDDLLRTSQSNITVKIGKDDTPPTISIVYPKNGAKLVASSSVGIDFQAHDGNGEIVKARYYLDGKLYQNDIQPPFEWQLKVPSEKGSHQLKVEVSDYEGNVSSDSLSFEVVDKAVKNTDGGSGGISMITSPSSNSSFEEGQNVNVSGSLSSADQQSIKQVIFLAKKSGQSAQVISTVPGNSDNASYNVVWNSPAAGTYEIYMNVVTETNSSYTTHVPIVVGN